MFPDISMKSYQIAQPKIKVRGGLNTSCESSRDP
jgi:hypothetical protein